MGDPRLTAERIEAVRQHYAPHTQGTQEAETLLAAFDELEALRGVAALADRLAAIEASIGHVEQAVGRAEQAVSKAVPCEVCGGDGLLNRDPAVACEHCAEGMRRMLAWARTEAKNAAADLTAQRERADRAEKRSSDDNLLLTKLNRDLRHAMDALAAGPMDTLATAIDALRAAADQERARADGLAAQVKDLEERDRAWASLDAQHIAERKRAQESVEANYVCHQRQTRPGRAYCTVCLQCRFDAAESALREARETERPVCSRVVCTTDNPCRYHQMESALREAEAELRRIASACAHESDGTEDLAGNVERLCDNLRAAEAQRDRYKAQLEAKREQGQRDYTMRVASEARAGAYREALTTIASMAHDESCDLVMRRGAEGAACDCSVAIASAALAATPPESLLRPAVTVDGAGPPVTWSPERAGLKEPKTAATPPESAASVTVAVPIPNVGRFYVGPCPECGGVPGHKSGCPDAPQPAEGAAKGEG